MKPLSIAVLLLLSASAAHAEWVNGYTRSNGTYVAPHARSAPDGNRFNNYSTQGNTNPYTGQAGTVNPYSANQGDAGNGFGGSGFNQPSTPRGFGGWR
ncbi:MAG: hypothetical protein WAZ18_03600 [Alphaproteobacteria bacterium]